MQRVKIFVSAYACEPGLGSEIGVGWHWVLEMSKHFELWVLTRKSNQNNIETWMNSQKEDYNIHFVYYDLPKALRFWKNGLHGVRTYYTIWQILTNTIVKRTMQENNIKIYHLLTYGNSLWKASSYGMRQFFVWGPTGGVDYISGKFTAYYGIKFKIREMIRRMVINTLNINRGFQKRCKNADLILCKSESMYEAVPDKYRHKAKIFTDCAVDENLLEKKQSVQKEVIDFITVGRLDAWRNFDVLVEAFTKAYAKNHHIRMKIVGDGDDADRIKILIRLRKMDKVIEMTGYVSIDAYYGFMREADVVINPSYKEGAVTMAFDAMALGKPFICIDTGGYTRYFSDKCAVILQRGPREKLISDMTEAIEKMFDKNTRTAFSDYAYELAKQNTWDKKGKEICSEIKNAYRKNIEVNR